MYKIALGELDKKEKSKSERVREREGENFIWLLNIVFFSDSGIFFRYSRKVNLRLDKLGSR